MHTAGGQVGAIDVPRGGPTCQFTLTVVLAQAMSAGMTVVYFPSR
jgi:hypothetical protein